MRANVPVSYVDRLFAGAERSIALIDRCRPVNAAKETERVMEAWDAGHVTAPSYRYALVPDLTPLSRALESVAADAPAAGPWGKLYAERAIELTSEVRVVESIGSTVFRERAAARFPADCGPFGIRASAAAYAWADLSVDERGRTVRSDDDGDSESLISIVRAVVGEWRLPIRVATTWNLPCSAAAGDGFILVQSGVWHRPECARRIALHEVLGHALPRHRAKSEASGLFSVATARGADDEEGRALVIEQRHSLFDDARRRELGVRHLAALAVRDGADFVDVTRLAIARGLSPRDSVRIAARVGRGGGLAREIVYLTARERVLAAFESDARIEGFLERGRIGVDAARILLRLGPSPRTFPAGRPERTQRNVATTGV
jgi:Microtubule-associated tyrosine carboxypeptidase